MGVMNGTQTVAREGGGAADDGDEGQIESSEVFEFQILFRTLRVTTAWPEEGAKL